MISNSLSPVWDMKFEIPLLHLNSKLTLKLFDEDPHKNDFLGIVEADISSFSLNEQVASLCLPVQQSTSSFRAQGTITFNAYVVVVETLVTIGKIDEDEETNPEEEEVFKPKAKIGKQRINALATNLPSNVHIEADPVGQ